MREKSFTEMVPESHLKLLAKTVLRANAYPTSYRGPGDGLVGKFRKTGRNYTPVGGAHGGPYRRMIDAFKRLFGDKGL